MIQEYAADLAAQMGVKLSKVTIALGQPSGAHDPYLLEMTSNACMVSERIHQSELDNLKSGVQSDLLELKIRSALVRLKILLEP